MSRITSWITTNQPYIHGRQPELAIFDIECSEYLFFRLLISAQIIKNYIKIYYTKYEVYSIDEVCFKDEVQLRMLHLICSIIKFKVSFGM